jgi:hypothetical protein
MNKSRWIKPVLIRKPLSETFGQGCGDGCES